MKKLIASLSVLASVCAFGAIDDTMVCFSTKGTDKYADGSDVLDGEIYALVWAQDTFDGFKADGTPVDANDEVVMLAYAKGGRCPLYAYALPASKFNQGGVLSLWMLDTRVQVADAADPTKVSTQVSGKLNKVAAAKEAGDVTITSSGVSSLASSETQAAEAGVAATLPTELPKASVKKIEIKNGKVYITVENTAAFLTYGVKTGDDPADVNTDATVNPVSGNPDQEIILVTEKKGDNQFFKVGQK